MNPILSVAMSWLLVLGVVLLGDAPERFRVATAPAESLAVTRAGAGRPVVLVPGLFGSAFTFRALLPLLAESGFQAIVIEPLGVGASSRPAGADYSLSAQADRLASALDQLGVESAVVVAHAVGAAIVYRLAYRRADLVGAIVSLEGGPAESAATPGMRRAMKLAPWLKWMGGVDLVRAQIHRFLLAESGDTSWVGEQVVHGYTADAAADLDATLRAYRAIAEAREPELLEPHLAEIRCPVRLLVGGHPHASRPGANDVERLRRALPAFSADTIAGVGHFLHEERPHVVLEAITALAARLQAEPGRALDGDLSGRP